MLVAIRGRCNCNANSILVQCRLNSSPMLTQFWSNAIAILVQCNCNTGPMLIPIRVPIWMPIPIQCYCNSSPMLVAMVVSLKCWLQWCRLNASAASIGFWPVRWPPLPKSTSTSTYPYKPPTMRFSRGFRQEWCRINWT